MGDMKSHINERHVSKTTRKSVNNRPWTISIPAANMLVQSNFILRGSTFVGVGTNGTPAALFAGLDLGDPLITTPGLHSAGGGGPTSREIVQGSSYPALPVDAIYLESSRWSVG
jgi:hypothetical protein